jgi:hypothetical protein
MRTEARQRLARSATVVMVAVAMLAGALVPAGPASAEQMPSDGPQRLSNTARSRCSGTVRRAKVRIDYDIFTGVVDNAESLELPTSVTEVGGSAGWTGRILSFAINVLLFGWPSLPGAVTSAWPPTSRTSSSQANPHLASSIGAAAYGLQQQLHAIQAEMAVAQSCINNPTTAQCTQRYG